MLQKFQFKKNLYPLNHKTIKLLFTSRIFHAVLNTSLSKEIFKKSVSSRKINLSKLCDKFGYSISKNVSKLLRTFI